MRNTPRIETFSPLNKSPKFGQVRLQNTHYIQGESKVLKKNLIGGIAHYKKQFLCGNQGHNPFVYV